MAYALLYKEADRSLPLKQYKKRKPGSSTDLKAAIVEYLERYPESKDTILGIAQWWVWEKPERVDAALEVLVEKGLIEKKCFSSIVLYSLDSAFKKDPSNTKPLDNDPNKTGEAQMKEKILVVDDEEVLRSLAKEILSEEGYQVMLAGSGEQAMDCLAREDFDLIITDLKMPGMDGMEFLKKIKERNEDTQVIFLTSHLSPVTALSSLKAGAFWYLTKPLDDISIFVEKVKSALQDKKTGGVKPEEGS